MEEKKQIRGFVYMNIANFYGNKYTDTLIKCNEFKSIGIDNNGTYKFQCYNGLTYSVIGLNEDEVMQLNCFIEENVFNKTDFILPKLNDRMNIYWHDFNARNYKMYN